MSEPLGDSLIGVEVCHLIIPGNPMSKSRPRMGKGGHTYTPEETKAAEEAIRWNLLWAKVRQDDDHLLSVSLKFRQKDAQRKDLDNLIKLVLDACNGFVWHDDFQVVKLEAEVVRRSEDPATELLVTRVGRYTTDCLECGLVIPKRLGRTNGGGFYCGRECYAASQRNGVEVPCVNCGAPVYQQASVTKRPRCADCKGSKARRKFCKRGHELTDENVTYLTNGDRRCRICHADRQYKNRTGDDRQG